MSNPFGMFYSLQFVVLVVCATLYYKAAELEDESGILWTGLSVGVFLLTWRVLGWSYAGNLFGQGVLMGGITLFRVWRDRKNST